MTARVVAGSLRPGGWTVAAWTVVAWAVAGLGWLLAAAAIVLLAVTGQRPAVLADWVMDIVVAVVYGAAVVLMLPRARHPAVWILAVTAVGCALAAFAEHYAALGGDLPGQHAAFYARFWAWLPGMYATVAIMPFLVLDGGSRRWRGLVVAAAVVAIVLATLPGMTVVRADLPMNPLGIGSSAWQTFLRHVASWPDRFVAVLGAGAAGWILWRSRRAPADERGGLRWLLAGQAVMVVSIILFLWPWPAEHAATASEVSGTLLVLAQAFLPVALLVLVLGRRLWGVDATVSRASVWLVMTVGVAVVYLVVVGAAAAWLPGGSDLSTALVVVVIGLGFAPVRAAVQRRVDQLVYGTSADPRRWWSSLGTPDTYDLDALAGALRLGLRLVDVRLLPVDPTGDLPSLEADAHETVLPLVSRGRVVGVLIAAPRPGERLDRRTAGMLEQVAGLAATTLDLLQSNEALEAARSRLVSIRHEERRVLRRDLHDGLGPALAGIRLGLSASRNLRERDPVAAEQMLDELQVELGRRSEDIRQLSRSLLPPALDDGDLRAALESLAARFAKAGLVVGLDVQEGMPIDPRQQIALYHIAGEAMLNVHRHARARRCEVVVDRDDDGGLRLAVIDDGVGLSDGDRPRSHGIGLRSMRERAEEIGGTVDVSRVDDRGGTRVTVHLPASR